MCSRPNDPAGEAPGGPKTSGTLGTTRSSRVQRKNGERDACGQRSADLPLKAPVAYHMLPCWLRRLALFARANGSTILEKPQGIGPLSASPQRCRRMTSVGTAVQRNVSLRGAARADWRGDSGINQAPTCQVADCGGNRERLGRHWRGGCRGGRSATDRDRHRKPDDYRRNRHDNDAAVGATDGERQPNYESASSQRLLRSNAGAVPRDRAGRPDRPFDANRRELNRADTRLI